VATTGGDDNGAARAEWLARVIGAAAEDAGVGIIMTLATDNGLRNIYANSAAESLLGREPGGLAGVDPLANLASNARPTIDPLVDSFVSTGASPPSFETVVTRPDGEQRLLEIGLGTLLLGSSPAVVSIFYDVTQRRIQRESLKKSGERFRTVVESIPEAIFMTRKTTLAYGNRAFVQLFGLDPERMDSPVDVLDLVHAADAQSFATHLQELSPGTGQQREYRMVTRDGRGVTLEVSAMGVDMGEPGALFLGHDVTLRRELEATLLQADRLEVLGTLAAGMAHAINNPLSYTLLNLEHVGRRMRELGADQDYYAEARVRLAEAHDGAERVAKVVRQMRALSRARSSNPGPADVRTVIDNVLSMIGNEIRYSAQLTLRYEAAPPVWAREGDLEQALLGLLLYVARALPEGQQKAREIRVWLGTGEDGNVVLTVSDDGLHLTDAENAALLDPFASSPKGLGLTMSHSVFTSLDGRLDVESGAQGGTVFRVVLPPAGNRMNEKSGVSVAAHAPFKAGPAPSRARVLVVDDDPGVASALRAMLQAQHEVKSVESAREGLRLLMGPEDFDVVFCDLVMPDLSGIELYCSLELNRPERAERLVFMTGGVFTPEAERFLARVPNPRIEKPFSLARVEQLLAQAVAKNTVPAVAR
jgi:PAS domain S-box-containing protein